VNRPSAQVCHALDDQAPILVGGGQVGPFFATHSYVVVATTTDADTG
jgi:hypothetical protein